MTLSTAATRMADLAPAEWLRDRLERWPDQRGQVPIGAIVPSGFPAYACLANGEGDGLELSQCRELAGLLRERTAEPESCWFAVWDGYGFWSPAPPETPKLELPRRAYVLYRGQLDAVASFAWGSDIFKAPDIWWPDDRSWCVGSDTDLDATYVAGSEDAIEHLISSRRLRAERRSVDSRVDS